MCLGNEAYFGSNSFRWYDLFRYGCESAGDEESSGKWSASKTNDGIKENFGNKFCPRSC